MKISSPYFAAFILLGLGMSLIGPALPALAFQSKSTLGQVSVLFLVRSLGYLLGSLGAGWLYDRLRLPGNQVMAAAVLGLGIALGTTPFAANLVLLSTAFLFAGFCEGITDVGGNTLLVWHHGSKVAPFMNALHFFFGVGTLVAPLIVAQLLVLQPESQEIAVKTFWVITVLALPVAAWLFSHPSPAHPQGEEHRTFPRQSLPLIFLVTACLMFYVGLEVTYGGWVFSYASTAGLVSQAGAAYLNAAFWGSFTVGRLISIPMSMRFSLKQVLVADLIGCLASVAIILIWPASALALWIGTFGLGLFFAAMFPSTISLAEQRITLTGQVNSIIFVGVSTGSMIFPWLTGQLFSQSGPGMLMLMMLALQVLCVLVYVPLLWPRLLPEALRG